MANYVEQINKLALNYNYWKTILFGVLHLLMRHCLHIHNPHQIRPLFSILTTIYFPSKPAETWAKHKDSMSKDRYTSFIANTSTKSRFKFLQIVDNINFKIQQMLPNESIIFKSIDTFVDENEGVNYPTEFLNSFQLPGIPPHSLI